MSVRKLANVVTGLLIGLQVVAMCLAETSEHVPNLPGTQEIASTQATPSSSTPGRALRPHPKLMAPHRPLPARVPDAKRHPLPPAKTGSVIGGIWMTDANLKSSLYLRSVIATTAITVKPIMYLSNGTKLPLGDVRLDPDGIAVIDLNVELEKQGISGFATLSGYVEVQYNWPWNPICAMVRALDPIHSLLFYYSLQPSLHIPRLKFKHGETPVQPPPPTATDHTVEGLWWKQEANVTAFVGLSNTTNRPLAATINVTDDQASPIAQHTVTISPHGMKLLDLTELATASSNSGGITVTYSGLRDDLLVDGALQDAVAGYSAMLPFMFTGTEFPDASETSVGELGLMLGPPDPMMSFPAGTTFTPYSVLLNISDAPVTVNPTLWWMSSGSAQYADIPVITLAPHQSHVLDMPSVLAAAGLTRFTGSVNLIFDAQAKPGSLLFSGGSVDKSNTYVFAVYPRGIQESASKSLSYWSTANGDDTMVTLWNPADEAQSFVFRLNYPGGHYSLPIQLGPKATGAFNLSDIIRSGTADAEGNIIPPSAHEGSATLMGNQGKIQKVLVAVDAATYNVKKATCGGQCWTCDGISQAFIDIYDFGVGANGSQTQENLYAWYDDAYEYDDTSSADWWSDHTGIMTVNTGMVTGQSAGIANISAFDYYAPVYDPNFCCETCSYCTEQGAGSSSPGTSQQPTYFNMTSADPLIDANCALGTGGAGATAHYQVLDQFGKAMKMAGMTPQEDLKVPPDGHDWGRGFLPFSTPQQTTSSGTFDDTPLGTCFGPPIPSNNVCYGPITQYFNIVMSGITYPITTTTTVTDCVKGITGAVSGNPTGDNYSFTFGNTTPN